MSSGTYFSLNTVGTDFWELVDGTKSVEDHAAVIAAKYEVDVPMVLADLIDWLAKWRKIRLFPELNPSIAHLLLVATRAFSKSIMQIDWSYVEDRRLASQLHA